MLTEKDYCDYELRLGLRDIGYPMSTCQINDGPIQMPKITLYEAQKFLREEKNIIVEVFVDDDSDTPITYNIYKDGKCVCHHHGMYWSVKEWEIALSEGIKEAVKILKENETIHE